MLPSAACFPPPPQYSGSRRVTAVIEPHHSLCFSFGGPMQPFHISQAPTKALGKVDLHGKRGWSANGGKHVVYEAITYVRTTS